MHKAGTVQARIEPGAGKKPAEDGCLDGNLFFEVSKRVESLEMLPGWIEWFKRLQVPCAVTKTREGYALWRKGKEFGRKRSQARSELKVREIVYSFGLRLPKGCAPPFLDRLRGNEDSNSVIDSP